jgi:hypothetical protein
VGLLISRLAISCYVVVSIWMFPAVGQTVSFTSSPATARVTALSGQEFHCHTGYPLAQCNKDILQLKSVLTRYPLEMLGPWTWVLVRSQDWKPISRMLRLSPDSPAFTSLDTRATFLEEVLLFHNPERTSELMTEWQRSMPALLELAVSHELGHAICEEPNEAVADRFGEDLRKGMTPQCRVLKGVKKKTAAGGEPHGLKPNISRVP